MTSNGVKIKQLASTLGFFRALANVWTYLTIFLFLVDFFSRHRYDASVSAVATIYLGILAFFVGTKEFDRWFEYQSLRGTRRGELYVYLWTALVMILAITTFFSHGHYTMPSELITTYIAVLGVFALSQRSKYLSQKKRKTP